VHVTGEERFFLKKKEEEEQEKTMMTDTKKKSFIIHSISLGTKQLLHDEDEDEEENANNSNIPTYFFDTNEEDGAFVIRRSLKRAETSQEGDKIENVDDNSNDDDPQDTEGDQEEQDVVILQGNWRGISALDLKYKSLRPYRVVIELKDQVKVSMDLLSTAEEEKKKVGGQDKKKKKDISVPYIIFSTSNQNVPLIESFVIKYGLVNATRAGMKRKGRDN